MCRRIFVKLSSIFLVKVCRIFSSCYIWTFVQTCLTYVEKVTGTLFQLRCERAWKSLLLPEINSLSSKPHYVNVIFWPVLQGGKKWKRNYWPRFREFVTEYCQNSCVVQSPLNDLSVQESTSHFGTRTGRVRLIRSFSSNCPGRATVRIRPDCIIGAYLAALVTHVSNGWWQFVRAHVVLACALSVIRLLRYRAVV